MSANGRTLRAVGLTSWLCMGRFTDAKKRPASANDTASAMNAAFLPKTDANTPPSAAPTANMIPHVLPNNALAFRKSSSLSVRLGIAALVAGPTKDAVAAIKDCARNRIQIPKTLCKSMDAPANI